MSSQDLSRNVSCIISQLKALKESRAHPSSSFPTLTAPSNLLRAESPHLPHQLRPDRTKYPTNGLALISSAFTAHECTNPAVNTVSGSPSPSLPNVLLKPAPFPQNLPNSASESSITPLVPSLADIVGRSDTSSTDTRNLNPPRPRSRPLPQALASRERPVVEDVLLTTRSTHHSPLSSQWGPPTPEHTQHPLVPRQPGTSGTCPPSRVIAGSRALLSSDSSDDGDGDDDTLSEISRLSRFLRHESTHAPPSAPGSREALRTRQHSPTHSPVQPSPRLLLPSPEVSSPEAAEVRRAARRRIRAAERARLQALLEHEGPSLPRSVGAVCATPVHVHVEVRDRPSSAVSVAVDITDSPRRGAAAGERASLHMDMSGVGAQHSEASPPPARTTGATRRASNEFGTTLRRGAPSDRYSAALETAPLPPGPPPCATAVSTRVTIENVHASVSATPPRSLPEPCARADDAAVLVSSAAGHSLASAAALVTAGSINGAERPSPASQGAANHVTDTTDRITPRKLDNTATAPRVALLLPVKASPDASTSPAATVPTATIHPVHAHTSTLATTTTTTPPRALAPVPQGAGCNSLAAASSRVLQTPPCARERAAMPEVDGAAAAPNLDAAHGPRFGEQHIAEQAKPLPAGMSGAVATLPSSLEAVAPALPAVAVGSTQVSSGEAGGEGGRREGVVREGAVDEAISEDAHVTVSPMVGVALRVAEAPVEVDMEAKHPILDVPRTATSPSTPSTRTLSESSSRRASPPSRPTSPPPATAPTTLMSTTHPSNVYTPALAPTLAAPLDRPSAVVPAASTPSLPSRSLPSRPHSVLSPLPSVPPAPSPMPATSPAQLVPALADVPSTTCPPFAAVPPSLPLTHTPPLAVLSPTSASPLPASPGHTAALPHHSPRGGLITPLPFALSAPSTSSTMPPTSASSPPSTSSLPSTPPLPSAPLTAAPQPVQSAPVPLLLARLCAYATQAARMRPAPRRPCRARHTPASQPPVQPAASLAPALPALSAPLVSSTPAPIMPAQAPLPLSVPVSAALASAGPHSPHTPLPLSFPAQPSPLPSAASPAPVSPSPRPSPRPSPPTPSPLPLLSTLSTLYAFSISSAASAASPGSSASSAPFIPPPSSAADDSMVCHASGARSPLASVSSATSISFPGIPSAASPSLPTPPPPTRQSSRPDAVLATLPPSLPGTPAVSAAPSPSVASAALSRATLPSRSTRSPPLHALPTDMRQPLLPTPPQPQPQALPPQPPLSPSHVPPLSASSPSAPAAHPRHTPPSLPPSPALLPSPPTPPALPATPALTSASTVSTARPPPPSSSASIPLSCTPASVSASHAPTRSLPPPPPSLTHAVPPPPSLPPSLAPPLPPSSLRALADLRAALALPHLSLMQDIDRAPSSRAAPTSTPTLALTLPPSPADTPLVRALRRRASLPDTFSRAHASPSSPRHTHADAPTPTSFPTLPPTHAHTPRVLPPASATASTATSTAASASACSSVATSLPCSWRLAEHAHSPSSRPCSAGLSSLPPRPPACPLPAPPSSLPSSPSTPTPAPVPTHARTAASSPCAPTPPPLPLPLPHVSLPALPLPPQPPLPPSALSTASPHPASPTFPATPATTIPAAVAMPLPAPTPLSVPLPLPLPLHPAFTHPPHAHQAHAPLAAPRIAPAPHTQAPALIASYVPMPLHVHAPYPASHATQTLYMAPPPHAPTRVADVPHASRGHHHTLIAPVTVAAALELPHLPTPVSAALPPVPIIDTNTAGTNTATPAAHPPPSTAAPAHRAEDLPPPRVVCGHPPPRIPVRLTRALRMQMQRVGVQPGLSFAPTAPLKPILKRASSPSHSADRVRRSSRALTQERPPTSAAAAPTRASPVPTHLAMTRRIYPARAPAPSSPSHAAPPSAADSYARERDASAHSHSPDSHTRSDGESESRSRSGSRVRFYRRVSVQEIPRQPVGEEDDFIVSGASHADILHIPPLHSHADDAARRSTPSPLRAGIIGPISAVPSDPTYTHDADAHDPYAHTTLFTRTTPRVSSTTAAVRPASSRKPPVPAPTDAPVVPMPANGPAPAPPRRDWWVRDLRQQQRVIAQQQQQLAQLHEYQRRLAQLEREREQGREWPLGHAQQAVSVSLTASDQTGASAASQAHTSSFSAGEVTNAAPAQASSPQNLHDKRGIGSVRNLSGTRMHYTPMDPTVSRRVPSVQPHVTVRLHTPARERPLNGSSSAGPSGGLTTRETHISRTPSRQRPSTSRASALITAGGPTRASQIHPAVPTPAPVSVRTGTMSAHVDMCQGVVDVAIDKSKGRGVCIGKTNTTDMESPSDGVLEMTLLPGRASTCVKPRRVHHNHVYFRRPSNNNARSDDDAHSRTVIRASSNESRETISVTQINDYNRQKVDIALVNKAPEIITSKDFYARETTELTPAAQQVADYITRTMCDKGSGYSSSFTALLRQTITPLQRSFAAPTRSSAQKTKK